MLPHAHTKDYPKPHNGRRVKLNAKMDIHKVHSGFNMVNVRKGKKLLFINA